MIWKDDHDLLSRTGYKTKWASQINTIGVICIFFFYSSVISKFSLGSMYCTYKIRKKEVWLWTAFFFFKWLAYVTRKIREYIPQKTGEEHPDILLLMALWTKKWQLNGGKCNKAILSRSHWNLFKIYYPGDSRRNIWQRPRHHTQVSDLSQIGF